MFRDGLSFEEKSVWIQLISTGLILGAYFSVAGVMLANGVMHLVPYVPVFGVAVVLLVVVMTLGHILAALTGRSSDRDERDRVIAWRAEHNSSWLLGAGVFVAIGAMVVGVDTVWIAHGLLLSVYISELLRFALQIKYYRLGVS